MRWGLLVLGLAALPVAQCASPSYDSSSTGAVSGSSTPPSMASVTGGQSMGMYDPKYGRTIYNSATPPPGTNLNY